MGIRADFRGFPYPAPSDGRSAELEAFEWLLETYRAELSQLFDLGRRQPVDDAARTVKGKLSHDPDHRTTLGICRQRFDIIYTLKPSTKHTSDPISRPAGHDPLLPLSFDESCRSTFEVTGLACLYALSPVRQEASCHFDIHEDATSPCSPHCQIHESGNQQTPAYPVQNA